MNKAHLTPERLERYKSNIIASLIIAAGVLITCTTSPIGGILVVLFGLACGTTLDENK